MEEKHTRIKKDIVSIDYKDTLNFFDHRAEKYNDNNPYTVTMYQDSHPELVQERNRAETDKLLPLLRLDEQSKVLDLTCGIGRWSDAVSTEIREYCGIDFSEKLIDIARERNHKPNRCFYVGDAVRFRDVLTEHNKGKYSRFLLIGLLMYINDDDVMSIMRQLLETADRQSIICIREPLGIDERLTLKGFYSEELQTDYYAVYRTLDELMNIFEKTLLQNGFQVSQSGFLFSNGILNNRSETAQYYFVLERG